MRVVDLGSDAMGGLPTSSLALLFEGCFWRASSLALLACPV